MGEDWLQATLTVPPPAAEAASGALFESGAGGVWEDLPDELGRVVLRGGFPQGAEMRLMAELPTALLAMCSALGLEPADLALTLELKPGEDYVESWKRDLRPITVADDLVIAPSWWDGPLPGSPSALVLRLDPGSAFGSGHHPTTFLCLRLLRDLAASSPKPAAILDLGSGSGVLAVAAASLWPEAAVTAIDNDPETIYCARANCLANGLADRLAPRPGELADLEGEVFDLILANLTRNTVLELAKELGRASRTPGRLIISGLLAEQTPEVLAALEALDFVCESHLGRAEWSALSFARGLSARPDKTRVVIGEDDESLEDSESFDPPEDPPAAG